MAATVNSTKSKSFLELWKIEYKAILLTILIYFVQELFTSGGIGKAIGLIITENDKSGFIDQSIWRLSRWPFLVKLLYAPVVDSIYLKSFGRRKTWIVPTAMITGGIIIYLSYDFDRIINFSEGGSIYQITFVYFVGIVFSATNDVAADAWVLTLFNKENVGLIGICSRFGSNIGRFIGFDCSLMMRDVKFSNQFRGFFGYDHQEYPLFYFKSFVFYVGCLYVALPILFAIFIKERDYIEENNKQDLTTGQTYRALAQITFRKQVLYYVFFVFSFSMGLFMCEAPFETQLVMLCYSKADLAKIGPVNFVLKLTTPWLFFKHINNGVPLKLLKKFWVVLLVVSLTCISICYHLEHTVLPEMVHAIDANFTLSDDFNCRKHPDLNLEYSTNWVIFISLFYIAKICIQTIFACSFSAFMMSISDPFIGGSAITLFNTLHNFRFLVYGPIHLYLLQTVGYYKYGFFISGVGLVLFGFNLKVMRIMSDLPRESWYYQQKVDKDTETGEEAKKLETACS